MIQLDLDTGTVDIGASTGVLTMLPGDPTLRHTGTRLERATLTPHGPATIDATWEHPGAAHVRVDGDGAAWLAETAPGLLGLDDDATGFDPQDRNVRDLWRRHHRSRIIRTGTLWHDLLWIIVQQRVDRTQAARSWRQLVSTYGADAPGDSGLLTPPDPHAVARLADHELHRIGIDRRRAATLRAAARAAARDRPLATEPFTHLEPRLLAIPGIGPWTTSMLSAVTWGEPDTVIVGDSNIPSMVASLLTGQRRATDTEMLELLQPYQPHRYRIIKLAFSTGRRPARHGPSARRVDIGRL